MRYEDLMDITDIFFLGLTEPSVNSLRLFFSRSKAGNTPEPLMVGGRNLGDSYSINIDADSPVIQIDFEHYIDYSIRNESFTVWDDYEIFTGKIFRVYTKSRYLDYIGTGTIASDDYPGPFKHYGMSCLDHIVDVISTDEPIIREVER
ncbi:hypothetical protein H7B90_06480 [Cohnella xylanilytica]|uniref:Uncharacterized protein n=1 Tax=Cohnella xylanilytica TaxID=557555 RepID=A0A841TRL8_9BACL|nr:hypothetical protein [Cohnella xylanilytica]MBB6691047.1 hypothetical protein [Cohnella xylanilytica]